MASRVLGAFAVTATAALATVALATPASAHTGRATAQCDEANKKTTLTVNLSAYAGGNKNTLKITDGTTVLEERNFGESWSKTWDNLDPTVDHKFVVDVKASDNRPGKNYDFYWEKTVTACVTPPTKPEQPKPEEPKPPVETPPVVTTTEAPSSSVTPPAPGGSTPEPPLAATGASPTWLLLSGLGLVGAGAGTLLFLRRRKSA